MASPPLTRPESQLSNVPHPALEPLVPCYIPSLAAVLGQAERNKGAPLTREEVTAVRDGAVYIMMSPRAARHMEWRRGYADIDPGPARCWEDWQAVRRKFV